MKNSSSNQTDEIILIRPTHLPKEGIFKVSNVRYNKYFNDNGNNFFI